MKVNLKLHGYVSTDNLDNELWVGDFKNADKIEEGLKSASIEYEKKLTSNATIFRFSKSTFMNVFFFRTGSINELAITDYMCGTGEDPKSVYLVFEKEERRKIMDKIEDITAEWWYSLDYSTKLDLMEEEFPDEIGLIDVDELWESLGTDVQLDIYQRNS